MVFTLLETVYHFFDATAKRRKVFKVEVVGDCYVAACGLPDPRKDHAVVMAKFAHECLRGMGNLTRELEVELGPNTTELELRVGLHSGPVVAGVLRGEKSRFQLFGDTMNTASRMKSTGVPNRIQVSQDTADLIVAGKKENWIIPREDKVQVKGKGQLSTYWIQPPGGGGATGTPSGARSVCSTDALSIDSGKTGDFVSLEDFQLREAEESTNHRIADWTVEVLACLLKEIEARRRADPVEKEAVQISADTFDLKNLDFCMVGAQANHDDKKNQAKAWEKKLRKKQKKKGTTIMDEVEEIIMLPDFNAEEAKRVKKAGDIQLSKAVTKELRDYVRTLASMYNKNRK
jgi:class 3 adenylate cyclase